MSISDYYKLLLEVYARILYDNCGNYLEFSSEHIADKIVILHYFFTFHLNII